MHEDARSFLFTRVSRCRCRRCPLAFPRARLEIAETKTLLNRKKCCYWRLFQSRTPLASEQFDALRDLAGHCFGSFMLVEVTFFQASLRASVPLQSALRSLHGPGFRCRAPQSKEKLHASTSCSWSTVASHHQWQLLIHLAAVVPNPEPVLKSRRFRQSLRTTAFFQLSCLRVDEAVARPLLRLLPSSPALVLAI